MEQITISNVNCRGKKLGIDVEKKVESKKIESLDLKGFEITEKIVKTLNCIPSLTNLCLYSCTFNSNLIADFRKIKKIVLDNCKKFDLSKVELPESVLIIGCGMVDLSKLLIGKNVKNLSICSSEIVNCTFFEKMKGLRTLNVDGSSLDDEEVLKKLKIRVSSEFEYHPIG